MGSQELYEAKAVEEMADTGAALLIRVDGEQVWIPYSQIEKVTRYPGSKKVDVLMTAWIAQKRGLI